MRWPQLHRNGKRRDKDDCPRKNEEGPEHTWDNSGILWFDRRGWDSKAAAGGLQRGREDSKRACRHRSRGKRRFQWCDYGHQCPLLLRVKGFRDMEVMDELMTFLG